MSIPSFTERIAKERNCSPELVRAIVTDFLAELHESTVKVGLGEALVNAYWEAGALGAWHFGGIIHAAAEHGEPGELLETYERLDPSMKRFFCILERWNYELNRERGEDR